MMPDEYRPPAIPLAPAILGSPEAEQSFEPETPFFAGPDFPGAVLHFRSIWISDVHLGTRSCQARMLLDFLKYTESDYLYLVGDIVDGWQLRKRWYWPQAHNDVIQKILRRAKHGTHVYFIPGNHDEGARPYCGLQFGGVTIANEVLHTTADGRKLLILHGDQFDAVMSCAKWLAHLGDKAYEITLFLNRLLNFARHRLGFPYWSLSAYLKHKVKNAVEHISDFENFIAQRARHHNADGVVCGHIHHAEIRPIGQTLYCNDGDWVESCTAMVEDEQGNLSIIHWPSQRNALLTAQTSLNKTAA